MCALLMENYPVLVKKMILPSGVSDMTTRDCNTVASDIFGVNSFFFLLHKVEENDTIRLELIEHPA